MLIKFILIKIVFLDWVNKSNSFLLLILTVRRDVHLWVLLLFLNYLHLAQLLLFECIDAVFLSLVLVKADIFCKSEAEGWRATLIFLFCLFGRELRNKNYFLTEDGFLRYQSMIIFFGFFWFFADNSLPKGHFPLASFVIDAFKA